MMGRVTPAQVADRSAMPTYRIGAGNRCGRCGGEQWLVGRVTAECVFCDEVLPLDSSSSTPGVDRDDRRAN